MTAKNGLPKPKGMEFEPERGIRCTMCFDMRFEKAAQYAHENGFHVFTSSLGISRWKDMKQINGCGHRAAEPYDDLVYWDFNWRKGGGSARMIEISKTRTFLPTRILRMRLLPARLQRPPQIARPHPHQTGRVVLR